MDETAHFTEIEKLFSYDADPMLSEYNGMRSYHELNHYDARKGNLSQRFTKPIKWHVRPVKTLISLGIRPVRSVSAVRLMGS